MSKELDKYTARDLLRAYNPELNWLKKPDEKISQLEIWAIYELRSVTKQIEELKYRLRSYSRNEPRLNENIYGKTVYRRNLAKIGRALGFHPEPTWCAVRDRLDASLNASRK